MNRLYDDIIINIMDFLDTHQLQLFIKLLSKHKKLRTATHIIHSMYDIERLKELPYIKYKVNDNMNIDYIKLDSKRIIGINSIYSTNISSLFINLQYLDIPYSQITTIPKELVSLKYLNISYTKITTIPDTLVNLTTLYAGSSNLTYIPNTFLKLNILCCNDTNMMEIPDTLINLTQLYCMNTTIPSIPDTLINLTHLYIYNTMIRSIPITITKLISLNCFGIQICIKRFTQLRHYNQFIFADGYF
jgi:Leucine-rich repeat (LRR) protein